MWSNYPHVLLHCYYRQYINNSFLKVMTEDSGSRTSSILGFLPLASTEAALWRHQIRPAPASFQMVTDVSIPVASSHVIGPTSRCQLYGGVKWLLGQLLPLWSLSVPVASSWPLRHHVWWRMCTMTLYV